MTLATTQTQFAPDDVLALEDEGLFELVDGKLVEKNMSSLATRSVGMICTELGVYLKTVASGGACFTEQAFQCFPHDPQMIRRPDLAVVVAERLHLVPDEGHVPVAPDLAVEVISPTDRVYDLEQKLKDYFSAGIKLVWVVSPYSRTVHVHRLDTTETKLGQADTLTGESVLPGFSVVVANLFPPLRAKA